MSKVLWILGLLGGALIVLLVWLVILDKQATEQEDSACRARGGQMIDVGGSYQTQVIMAGKTPVVIDHYVPNMQCTK